MFLADLPCLGGFALVPGVDEELAALFFPEEDFGGIFDTQASVRKRTSLLAKSNNLYLLKKPNPSGGLQNEESSCVSSPVKSPKRPVVLQIMITSLNAKALK